MSEHLCGTPIAFIIFNRPDTAERVFAEIAKAKPPKLLVVADGPRPSRPGEAEKCTATRAIIERVDWDCEVLTNYSDINLGCKHRVSSGIDWVFQQVEEAIILEDDCLPHPTFFRFCEELLARYRDDERIAIISGDNFQSGRRQGNASYYFSRYTHIWGWASWRRAWKHYDVEMKLWPQIKSGGWLNGVLAESDGLDYWTKIFDRVYGGGIDTWDYQWVFACWIQSGLSVLPNINLISNIGFGNDATHTQSGSPFAELPVGAIPFPLTHPSFVLRHRIADSHTHRIMFSQPLWRRVARQIRDAVRR